MIWKALHDPGLMAVVVLILGCIALFLAMPDPKDPPSCHP
jgi:hypothetical protein